MATKELTFTPLGHGIEAAVEDNALVVRVSRDPNGARLSSTGKMKLTASTGGWITVPGTDFRLMLNAGTKA